MATKPQSYPEKIQALKVENEQLRQERNDALQNLAARDGMLEELAELRGKVAALSNEERQEHVGNKAKETDLIQRADNAEAVLRSVQTENKDYLDRIEQLESQLDLLGKVRFQAQDLEMKNQTLAEELKTTNFRLLNCNNRITEIVTEKTQQLERLSQEKASLSRAYEETRVQAYNQQELAVDKLKELNEFIAKQELTIDRLSGQHTQHVQEIGRLQTILRNIQSALDGQ